MDTEVEEVPALVPLDKALADRQKRRAAHRRMFREMIHGELDAGPLTWLRRRALVKFAERLEIEEFEARLLIRGVEYEGAVIPEAAMPSSQAAAEASHAGAQALASIVRWLVLLLTIAITYWVVRHGPGWRFW
jgi:hypothetical protein